MKGSERNVGVSVRRGKKRAMGKGRMRDGERDELSRKREEEEKRDKESGNQRERGCYAFPQHSFSPIQRAVKRQ